MLADMDQKPKLSLILLCYTMIYFIWGSTYLFIAFAVETIPAPWILFIRFTASGLVFMVIAIARGGVRRFPNRKEIQSAVFLGVFLMILGNGIITWAEKTVDSHLAALLVSSVPLIVALYNVLLYRTRLNLWQIAGMLVGISGVVLLLFRGRNQGFHFSPGIILILLATFCWAFGTSFSRRLTPHSDILMHTGMQMMVAALISWPVAVMTTGKVFPSVAGTTPLAWLSVFYLAFIGGSAIIGYNYLLKHEPTSRITTYAFVNPVVATLLGLFIRGEHAGPFLWPGMLLVLGGLFFILYMGRVKKVKKPCSS